MFVPWGGAETAAFISRPNRFTVLAALGGDTVVCHLPSTGRLAELLVPGARMLVRRATGPSRKTGHDVLAVWWRGAFTAVDTRLAGRLVARQLQHSPPPWLPSGTWRREVVFGEGRLDFGLEGSSRGLMELKTVTLIEGETALFPDAPTERGARHLRLLEAASRAGYFALVWFVIMREGAACFRPNEQNDPAFAEALRAAAAAGVKVRASAVAVGTGGLALSGDLPVCL